MMLVFEKCLKVLKRVLFQLILCYQSTGETSRELRSDSDLAAKDVAADDCIDSTTRGVRKLEV